MNLTDAQWRLIEPILPSQAGRLLRHTLPVSFGRNDLLAQFKHIIYNQRGLFSRKKSGEQGRYFLFGNGMQVSDVERDGIPLTLDLAG